SLVGTSGGAVTILSNGNYVVRNPNWNGNRGAVTWGDGSRRFPFGPVSDDNSLVGSNSNDQVGSGVVVLPNGDYVVRSPNWNRNRGAATWVDGVKGIAVTGPVSNENSLVGPNENDFVGSSVTGLTNGNYVVSSPRWNENRGAVTWGGGAGGVRGEVTVDN